MSVPFPYTVDKRGAGIARLVVSDHPVHSDNDYVQISPTQVHHQPVVMWFLDARLDVDSNTFAAMLSAFNTSAYPMRRVYLSMTDVPANFRLAGASCGLAAFLALLGVTTDIVVTGFIVSFANGSPSIEIEPVDETPSKIDYCLRNRRRIIVPAICMKGNPKILSLFESGAATTYQSLFIRRNPPTSVGLVDSVADLAFVLTSMDPSVDLHVFAPHRHPGVAEAASSSGSMVHHLYFPLLNRLRRFLL